MTRPAIVVDNLSKSYRIGRDARRLPTFRESLSEAVKAPLRRLRRPAGGDGAREETFWALRGVSFAVEPGEVVGIVGRNGAGKSTLLKVLSRITEPTDGCVRLRGRVASLLEVGTGFHPELTGRENVYLNGSILGMARAEITRKFDEIVAFAGVERFLDTPVKHYSSGMYVRLAFSVAAHLEPEILIVDEVLAVGDAEFQKKCLGKMREVSRGDGRTVLFVSHNMNAVAQLCQRAVLLRNGELAGSGPALEVIREYSTQTSSGHAFDLAEHPNRDPSLRKVLRRIEMYDAAGKPSPAFPPLSPLTLRLSVRSEAVIRGPRLSVGVNNWRGERVFSVATFLGRSELPALQGERVVEARFVLPALVPGQYTLDVGVADDGGRFLDAIFAAAAFDVLQSDYLETTQMQFDEMGQVMVRSEWNAVA